MDKILKRLDAGLENSAQDASKTVSVLDAIQRKSPISSRNDLYIGFLTFKIVFLTLFNNMTII